MARLMTRLAELCRQRAHDGVILISVHRVPV
jgi:hypothetical protein